MDWRWFISKTVRQASDFCRQARRMVNEQRDLLPPANIAAVTEAIDALRHSIRSGGSSDELRKGMSALEQVAAEKLRAYPHPSARENTKEIMVAVTLILGITTFFLQLTKIPTGSLQPTLYGITYHNLRTEVGAEIPGFIKRFALYWIQGIQHFHIVAQNDGELRLLDAKPRVVFPFVRIQRISVGGKRQIIWFAADELFDRARVPEGRHFRRGEDILKMKVVAGDHLLVDRISYNFRRPGRGEIIVFKTKGIRGLDQDVLYIKRLVALENERVQIGNDQHLIINGRRLDASTPHFENVYSFSPVPRPNEYFGHVNGIVAARVHNPNLAPLFTDESAVHTVAPNHFMAMGDNTLNSYDSRAWGDLPQENVTGRCWFVYWPITERFGWGTR